MGCSLQGAWAVFFLHVPFIICWPSCALRKLFSFIPVYSVSSCSFSLSDIVALHCTGRKHPVQAEQQESQVHCCGQPLLCNSDEGESYRLFQLWVKGQGRQSEPFGHQNTGAYSIWVSYLGVKHIWDDLNGCECIAGHLSSLNGHKGLFAPQVSKTPSGLEITIPTISPPEALPRLRGSFKGSSLIRTQENLHSVFIHQYLGHTSWLTVPAAYMMPGKYQWAGNPRELAILRGSLFLISLGLVHGHTWLLHWILVVLMRWVLHSAVSLFQ